MSVAAKSTTRLQRLYFLIFIFFFEHKINDLKKTHSGFQKGPIFSVFLTHLSRLLEVSRTKRLSASGAGHHLKSLISRDCDLMRNEASTGWLLRMKISSGQHHISLNAAMLARASIIRIARAASRRNRVSRRRWIKNLMKANTKEQRTERSRASERALFIFYARVSGYRCGPGGQANWRPKGLRRRIFRSIIHALLDRHCKRVYGS